MNREETNIIIYNTDDGKTSVALYAHDGNILLNQQQMVELFATSKQTVSHHVVNILKERELDEDAVVKNLLTTATDGKSYKVIIMNRADAKKPNMGLTSWKGRIVSKGDVIIAKKGQITKIYES